MQRLPRRVWWSMVWLGSVVVSSCGTSGETQVDTVLVVSPDGALRMTLATDRDGRITYSVSRNGDLVVGSSPLGLVSDTHDLSRGVTLESAPVRSIEESYSMRTGKRSVREVLGNEVAVPVRDANGAKAELVLRAHDDGIAFRYRLLGEGESEVQREESGFAIPGGGRLLTRAYDGGDAVFTPTAGEYQQPPLTLPVGEPIERTGFAFPTLFELDGGGTYLMVSEADLGRSYCGTRLHEMPDGDVYQIRFPDAREGRGIGSVLPKSSLPFTTPWRVIIVGSLATIVESTLVDDLSTPSTVDDDSWIAPGRAAWSWFSQETGTPELQSEYVDFASELGWEYVLIDAKWDQWDDADRAVQSLVERAEAGGSISCSGTTREGVTPLRRARHRSIG